jgi:type II secretory pathway pseudopilin PulG
MRHVTFKRTRPAFTLVEMLAVIGIIVLLVGILVPTVMSARRQADKNAARMELQTIAMALDAYRADFGDYPHPPVGAPCVRVLAWALIGPYNADAASGGPNNPFGGGVMTDGADGPGFRTVYDTTTKKGGKVWGPYLPPDKFHLVLPGTPTSPPDLNWDILDRYGSPIEYFPRWRKYKAGQNMHLFGTDAATASAAVYDYRQQWQPNPPVANPPFNYPAANYFRKALGDDNLNDLIEGAEVAKEMPPFLLISKGQYKMYSTNNDIQTNFAKCDEITNLQH